MADIAPYQSHSDTSREAAETLHDRRGQNKRIYDYILAAGKEGRTGDEIAAQFDIAPGTASARISDLMNPRWCEANLGINRPAISKTPMRRKTRMGKSAVVHIAGSWTEFAGIEVPKQPTAREKLAQTGHGHVVPRTDGTRMGCGGTFKCKVCQQEESYLKAMEGKDGTAG